MTNLTKDLTNYHNAQKQIGLDRFYADRENFNVTQFKRHCRLARKDKITRYVLIVIGGILFGIINTLMINYS